QAAAAFGPEGLSLDLASPATPEAVYWAVQHARAALEPSDPQYQPSQDGDGAPARLAPGERIGALPPTVVSANGHHGNGHPDAVGGTGSRVIDALPKRADDPASPPAGHGTPSRA